MSDIISSLLLQKKQNPIDSIPMTYLAQLRGLLDSYFNSVQLQQQEWCLVTSFTDFFFAWFYKFSVDPTTKVIQCNTQHNRKIDEENRSYFLQLLSHPLLNRHWESVTFKNFLAEKYSPDEIYFYLYYRHMILQGHSLQHIDQKVTFNTTINYQQAITIITFIFDYFDPDIIQLLHNVLKNQSTHSNTDKNNSNISFGFFLQLILDFYINQKQRLIMQIYELFRQGGKKQTGE